MRSDLIFTQEMRPSDNRFGSGPSLIPQAFMDKLAKDSSDLLGTSHRKKAVIDLCKEMQEGIHRYFNLPAGYQVIFGNGGATLLFDMIGLGLVKKKSLHYTMGEFSSKWFKAHSNIPWIETKNINTANGSVTDILADDNFDMICCTLNETSTGAMIGSLPQVGSKILLAVDATSGAGQIPQNFNLIDVYFFSPQKVFASEGGLYISILSPKAIARANEIAESGRYIPETMNWELAINTSAKNQSYNTPAISTIFLLNEQLKMMNKLGEKKVVELAREKAKLIYDWAESKAYLNPYVQDPASRSISVATINVDEKYSVSEISNILFDHGIAKDIEGYRKLGENQLRISLFHNISFNDIKALTRAISFIIESQGGIDE